MDTPRRTTLDDQAFRDTLGRFASGVTVLTLREEAGGDRGMTVTAFSSLSLDPPLVLACIGKAASIAPSLSRATHFAVHVLAADQESLARRFAEKDGDRFGGLTARRGIEGLPLIDGAVATLQCRIAARHPGGDHEIVVGEVLDASSRDGEPLLYFRGRYGGLVR
jgi:3-hydroxy-9,10-secoandrosta-1,3,5(10)-triene-9,17-dione monooxygenase reductase component